MPADAPAVERPSREDTAFRVCGHVPERIHVYEKADGELVGVAARFAPGTLNAAKKEFRVFRYESGEWRLGLNGCTLPLYNLPGLRAGIRRGELVFVPEGENCVDRLCAQGLTATTNPFGAGKWESRYTDDVTGADVVILPDQDEPGKRHAEAIARSLHGKAASIRILELPGLPPKGDLCNWLDAGGNAELLSALAENAPVWTPPVEVNDGWPEPTPFGTPAEAEVFPVASALPPLLAELTLALADTVMVDPAAPAMLVPIVLSAAAGNPYCVAVSPSYAEPCLARYGGWAAESGERKSELFRRTVSPLDAWGVAQEPDYRRRLSDAKAQISFLRHRADALDSKGAKAKNDAEVQTLMRSAEEVRRSIPPLPRRPVPYVGDVTQEALVRHLAETGGALAVMSADARHVVDGLLGRHRQDGGTDDSVYLRAHGGDSIDRSRIGKTPEGEFLVIRRPSLAVGICIQPDKLAHMAGRPELLASGFLPRCNLVQPRSLVGERIETGEERPIDRNLAAEWERIVGAILQARFQIIDAHPDGQWEKVRLQLSPEAMIARREFANEIERRQRPDSDLHGVGGFASKTAGEAARLAALYHLAELAEQSRVCEAEQIPIPLSLWRCAELAQRWHLAESLRVLSLSTEDVQTRSGRRLLAWVARKPEERRVLQARDVVGGRLVEDSPEATRLLDWLADRGWTRRISEPGAKAPRWEVHPLVLRGGAR